MSVVTGMTFLQLAQRLQQESATSGGQQTSVANATGEWKRMCDWIATAYVDLQMMRQDWLWMSADVVFDTIANQQPYSPYTTNFSTPVAPTGLTDFGHWEMTSEYGESSFRLYLKSAGIFNETYLDGSLSYPEFRDYYQFGARRTTPARPISITVDPQKNILLGLTPNDIYTVLGRYHKAPQQLALDADVPDMPARFHMLIVWYALEHYAFYESAQEAVARAKIMYPRLLSALMDDQLPAINLPGPLA